MVIQNTMPVLRENTNNWYIEFYAYDPERGKLRRKTIKLNRIKSITARRKYAREVIKRLVEQLSKGWNPWIAKDTGDLQTFGEVLDRYERHIEKMIENGYYRKETYAGYKSNVKILREYVTKTNSIYYVYQFDHKYCVDFLDYVFIDRENGAQTRNNYLNFLRVFAGFMLEKGYIKERPTDGIRPISRRLFKKERTCIPLDVVTKVSDYCKVHDKHFQFACYLLYYCFIRPVEMTRLRVRDFNLKSCTLTIPADCAKNHRKQTVTLPKKVLLYAVELGIFKAPMGDFIFSRGLKPGNQEIDPKHFRDHWEKVRKALGLKKEWKFYSLKDTGITEMLKHQVAPIEVRDQARHSSLAITEIYTDRTNSANQEIVEFDGAL